MADSKYTGISITHEARDDVRTFAARAGGVLGNRVLITDALRLAVHIASAHMEDVPASALALGIAPLEEETP